ncbi:MAG: hypothetical protein K2I04_00495 [Muribaculaceae bacterium]|nr:hypothetical protein [Muribaculaceae bacterium]
MTPTDDALRLLMCHDALRRRARELHVYDPLTGRGSFGARTEVKTPGDGLPRAAVPDTMLSDPLYKTVVADSTAWRRLRCRHDFEYWAATCVRVKDKQSSRDIPFVLNAPQRRVLGILEQDRLARRPMRMILLKARQWGGSTLVQMYMAWIQSCHMRNWHSVICAHVRDTAAGIRGMYAKMLGSYPEDMWEGDAPPCFKPYERSTNTRVIVGRDCRVTIGSGEKPDSIRGADYAMAHLSETAYWPSSRTRTPEAVMQAVCGGICLLPYSLVVVESTARGVGDFFHAEWLRAKAGKSDKRAVFVPWNEIAYYRLPCPDPAAVLGSMTPYERQLWEHGCDSGQILWYRHKTLEFESLSRLNAEFPADDIEAFTDSSDSVFSAASVEVLRSRIDREPVTGDVDTAGQRFTPDSKGKMKVWEGPQRGARYVAAVDVGGRSASSDWSVIAVLRADTAVPTVVAQWRGHVDHDILARKSVAVARYYNTALLVIESNTYETADYGGSSDSNLFILSRLAEEYPNIYRRESFDTLTRTRTTRVGFHTNRSTKAMLIAGLIEAVRDATYVERDPEACNELLTYRSLPNGAYAARDGRHDDILMTRAIALHVIRTSALATARMPQRFTQRQSW